MKLSNFVYLVIFSSHVVGGLCGSGFLVGPGCGNNISRLCVEGSLRSGWAQSVKLEQGGSEAVFSYNFFSFFFLNPPADG